MFYDIAFPHLGIFIETLKNGITLPIGVGFKIAYYGILIGTGMLAGFAIACWDGKRKGLSSDLYSDIFIWGIIVGVICARLYYVAFMWDYYRANPLQILNIRGGGLAIYGGIIGAFVTLLVYSKIKKVPFFKIADSLALGLPLGQAIGRWGNFFNCEAFGNYTDSLFAMRIRYEMVGSGMLGGDVLEHIIVDNGAKYIQVHPTFLYESAWNVLLLIILLVWIKRQKIDGEIAWMYVSGYGLGRFLIEGIRTDSLMIAGSDIRVSQALAGVCFIAGIIMIVRGRIKAKTVVLKNDECDDNKQETICRNI